MPALTSASRRPAAAAAGASRGGRPLLGKEQHGKPARWEATAAARHHDPETALGQVAGVVRLDRGE